ncbi:group 2 glycosyl transferase [Neisseria arctica]|uniref:Group 2 glycosyl transferase n=1 Tax=Neisseria arctica TaxID=1470200 RepID=A0A0J1C3C2_9NEIS|nr:glycosyltransferase family 2 protein [Neisseria arctica]KLT72798.1 group 2 glycosyl transferase [Neisseria arctica]UOO86509.1 glycosyltransferase family 2 protein [Neisseria arctica]
MSNLSEQLTIALITKNEAHHLPECLKSVQDLGGSMVIIDSGSTDETPEIARQFGAEFHVFPDWQGFGRQRNRAHQFIQTPWVLWLDADERLSATTRQDIIQQISQIQPDGKTLFSINRLSMVYGREIRHSGWYPDRVVRCYPVKYTQYSDDLVHESVVVPNGAKVVELKGDVLHYTYADIAQFMRKSAQYAQLWAQQKKQQGKKVHLHTAVIHGAMNFLKTYVLKAGFLDGKQGFLLATLSAYSVFCKYAQLWVLNHERK